MKKPTTQQFAIRLIAGLALIGLAVFFAFTLEGYTGPESTMWQRTIYIMTVMGVGLGGFACIFFGFWGVLGGLAFVLFLTLPRALPDPWNRYYAIVYLLALLGLKPLLTWWKQRKIASATKDLPEEPIEPEDAVPALSENSVVATNEFSGRTYQLFRQAGQIIGYRVGGEIRGIDPDKLRTTPGDIPDFTYRLDEIQKVRSRAHGQYGICITFRAGGHTYYFVPTALSDEAALEDFFRPFAPDAIPPKKKPQPATQSQQQRRVLLSKIRTGLLVAIALINLPWLFLNVPYKLFAALALIPCPVILTLSCLFPEDISLDDKPKNANGRIELLSPMIFSGMVPCLRLLFDFNILDWPRLLIFAAVLLAAIFAILFYFNKPLRKKIGSLIATVFLCAFFAVGAVGQLNYLLDFSQPQSQTAQVTDMRVSTSSKGPDRYTLTVTVDNGAEMDLQVSKSEYQSLNTGDQVAIFILSGGLGIPYAVVG